MQLKPFIFIFVFIVLSISVLAVKPIPPTQQGGNIAIESIKLDFFKGNIGNIQFFFHAFNSTGYRLSAPTTNCSVHIYNQSGVHVIEDKASMIGDDYVVVMGNNITLKPAIYAYIIYCTNIYQAGYISDSFELAFDNPQNTSIGGYPLAVIMLLPIILAFILLFGAKLLPDDHAILKAAVLVFSLILFLVSFAYSIQVTGRYYNFPSLMTDFGWGMYLIGGFLFVIFTYIVVYIGYQIYLLIAETIEQRKEI